MIEGGMPISRELLACLLCYTEPDMPEAML